MLDLAASRNSPRPRSRKKPEVQTRSHSITAAARVRPGTRKGQKAAFSAQKKVVFFFPQNGFEAQALGVETNQPPSALNAPPFLV